MKAPIPSGLDAEQTKNAYTIYREFARAYPRLDGGTALAIASVTNAKAESNLRNVRTGIPGEDSAGLFQLNVTNPHGAELAGLIDLRLNPAHNTRGIIKSLEDSGGPVFDALRNNASVATIADRFRVYVERPANAELRGQETAALAGRLFPSYANTRALALPRLDELEIPMNTTPLLYAGLAAVLGLLFFGGA